MPILAVERDWKNVSRLVFEWSFTKDPSLGRFRDAIAKLKRAGFAVAYDGRGTSADAGAVWPGRTDVLVFAARDPLEADPPGGSTSR